MMITVKSETQLKNMLKLANIVSSGGEAKHRIKEGDVLLNGEVELRPSKKLFEGDIVTVDGEEYKITIDDH